MAESLILASASPRRLELLRLAGLDPVVRPAAIDESLRGGEAPADYVVRLAREKATAADGGPAVVLAADTAVVLDGVVLGKPDDRKHAATMLRALSGRSHVVATGVAVKDEGGEIRTRVVSTQVVFTELAEEQIVHYAATNEPLDKAGAYAIQGGAAAFVARIEGSYTNVVGLPLVESLELLRAAGVIPRR